MKIKKLVKQMRKYCEPREFTQDEINKIRGAMFDQLVNGRTQEAAFIAKYFPIVRG